MATYGSLFTAKWREAALTSPGKQPEPVGRVRWWWWGGGGVHAATHSHKVGVFLWDPWRHLLSRSTNGQPEILNMERMIITSFSSLEYSQRLVVTLVWQCAVLGLHTKPHKTQTVSRCNKIGIKNEEWNNQISSDKNTMEAPKTRLSLLKV